MQEAALLPGTGEGHVARLRSLGQSPPAGCLGSSGLIFPAGMNALPGPTVPAHRTTPKSAIVPREGAERGWGHRSIRKALVRRCPRRRIHPFCTREDRGSKFLQTDNRHLRRTVKYQTRVAFKLLRLLPICYVLHRLLSELGPALQKHWATPPGAPYG